MPLRVPPAPAPVLRCLPEAPHPGDAGGTGAELRHPLPVHEIRREPQRQGPPRTRLTAWRLQPVRTAESGAGGTATEVTRGPDGWRFGRLCAGPYIAATALALRQADALPLPYQPRLLSVPDLYMLTLWLHGDPDADPAEGFPGAADLLIPLAPAPPGIEAHRTHRMDALMPLLAHRMRTAPLLGTAV